jgi:hypothetical protein
MPDNGSRRSHGIARDEMIDNGPGRKDPGSSIVLDPPAARQCASSAENIASTLPIAGTVEASDPGDDR